MNRLTVSGNPVATVAASVRAICRSTLAVYLACQGGVHSIQPVLAQEAAARPGYYAIDLETAPTRTRDRCILIGISALGGTLPRSVRLVARSTDGLELLPGHARPVYETIKEVPVAAVRFGQTEVCFNDVQMFVRMSADGMPPVMQVAVFPLDAPTPVGRDWSTPQYDTIRLSDWTAVLVPGWQPVRRPPVGTSVAK